MRRDRLGSWIGWVALVGTAASAAVLPPHAPLRILVVSDEVNPHGLPPDELTQPGDLSAALLVPDNGLQLDSAADAVVEIATNDIDLATELLELPPEDPTAYDVLVYFAHRIPDNGESDFERQQEFTAAVEQFLIDGGGVVSFHHGAYLTGGKEGILDLIGGTASGDVVWNTAEGQRVIAVAPDHFVTRQGVSYDEAVLYADPGRGVPSTVYPAFTNVPDERYPSFELNATAGEIELLFASDYDQNGTEHLLGFTHRRVGWRGVVVAFQPGEHEPTALDVDGRNFQILANAIVWSAEPLRRCHPSVSVQCGLSSVVAGD